MSISLSEIQKPIKEELILFEKHFKSSVKTNVALLDKIMYYIVKRKGKQIRPMFVFLCAQSCGKINDSTYIAASLIELLHTGTLVHDDVVDDSMYRRGFFSVSALWKNKIAVLVGDYLLSRGFLLALDNDEIQALKILSNAVKLMSEGELLQIEKARRLDIQEDIYYDIIKRKTASLIAAACSSGAASTTDDLELVERFRLFGETLGMAFQIKDDLFDYGEADIGKPRGIDIKEKKMTLPLIYSLQNTDKKTKKRIINGIKKNSTDNRFVKEVIDFVKSTGGIAYAEEKMQCYHQSALELLDTLPMSEAVDSLKQLAQYVIDRKK
ncbi:MAG: polyprenyl synthetase family protein [Saprospiraceae bacterium]|nr:polyprenyl synthetase family protein [Saprospiraceae bacterium]